MSPKLRPYVRGAVDYGGPLVFFVAYLITRDMIAATWALVAGSAVALAIGFAFERRLAPMPLLAGGAALVFGALTLIFHDARFVKMKPTFLNTAFAIFLLGGVMLKKNPLKVLLGEAVSLPEDSWRTLTLRYGVFFLCVAILNEVVWRTQPETTWVVFRFPGLQILALAFSAAQVPLMMKGMKAMEAVEAPPPPVE
ncbi:septation protein A [Caulobacter segnis]|uniref:inner membrane-spanning protein YciB n=1 Tax=Caulobacter segnis TaxID=88688 RepID=UPI002410B542|nr:inner membrane-spanning protein YciB [Caulobacter segnis]MDG2520072.1 septation protein A [Caulobacter segnis]